MPDDVSKETDSSQTTDGAPQSGGSPAGPGKFKVIGFVVAVIVVECLIAYLWLPSASETAALAGVAVEEAALGGTENQPGAADDETEEEEPAADLVEVDLGEFRLTTYQPLSNTTLRIDFHLYGTVAREELGELEELKKESEHRFREQVIMIMRNADLGDLNDAGLGLIKRKVLEKSNAIFGKPLLKIIIFSDFSYIEQ